MAATDSARYAWQTAERRCFDYLCAVLGQIEDVAHVLGRLPRTIGAISDLNQWAFEINGGGDAHFVQPTQRRMVKQWHMRAVFMGRFTERAKAQEVAGLLRDYLPAGESNAPEDILQCNLAGIQQINRAAHEQIDQQTAMMASDNDEGGGERPVWQLTVPMFVVFENQDQIT